MLFDFSFTEVKVLRWLLETVIADQKHFLEDETDPGAVREATHAKRGAEKLLKRLTSHRSRIASRRETVHRVRIRVVSKRDANGDSEIRLVPAQTSTPAVEGVTITPRRWRGINDAPSADAGVASLRRTETDLATLLNCAEADLLGFLDSIDVSPEDNKHPAAQTVRDLHAALKQIEPGHACRVDQRGGAR